MSDELLIAELRRDEGVRSKPYRCSAGKLTVGVGRNLDDVGLSDDEINYLLRNDIERAEADLDRYMAWWRELDAVRSRVLMNMAFNMGIKGLLGFKNTLSAVKAERWEDAAKGMLASKWARQVGKRATRLAEMMRTGTA